MRKTVRQARERELCVSNVAARATGNLSVYEPDPDPEEQHLIPTAKFVNTKDTERMCVR